MLRSLIISALHQSLSQFGITEFSPEICCCMEYFTYKFICIKSYLICPTYKVWPQLSTLTCSFIIVLLIPFTPERLISLLLQACTGHIFFCFIFISPLPLGRQLFPIQPLSKSKQIFKTHLKTSPAPGSLPHLWHH